MLTTKTASEVEPHWLNKSEMAKSLGISIQAFDKWGVKPIAKVGRSVYFVVSDVLHNRVEREIEKHQPAKLDPDQLDEGKIEYERYRLTKAQADAQELKNDIAEGKVVPAEFATFTLSRIAAESAGVLDSLPLQITRKLPDLTTRQTEEIKRELAKAMNSMSRLDEILPGLLDEYIEETT